MHLVQLMRMLRNSNDLDVKVLKMLDAWKDLLVMF